MNTWNCKTVIVFGPHITPHCQAAPWWDLSAMTPLRLGWWIVAALVLAWLFAGTDTFIRNRWEIAGGRVARRWYAPGSVIRDRDTALSGRYRVRAWDYENTPVPWLQVEEIADFEGADPLTYWAPVTSFASVTVRRFRPHLIRCVLAGRVVLIPWPVKHLPLPGPVAIWRGEP